MIFRTLFIALACTSFSVPVTTNDFIQWNPSRRLNWNDFKGSPPRSASNAALTSSGILMKFSTNGEWLDYQISCNFDKNSSWGRVKNDHILSHEQGHFDISEIYARKLNKTLKAYHPRGNSVTRDVNEIYKKVMDELLVMQNKYDEETDYSRNFRQQENWLSKIDGYLEGLKDYADYH